MLGRSPQQNPNARSIGRCSQQSQRKQRKEHAADLPHEHSRNDRDVVAGSWRPPPRKRMNEKTKKKRRNEKVKEEKAGVRKKEVDRRAVGVLFWYCTVVLTTANSD